MGTAPRLVPVQVPYDSARSRRLGRQVLAAYARGAAGGVRVGQWELAGMAAPDGPDFDWYLRSLAVGFVCPWPEDYGVNPWWVCVLPDCRQDADLGEIARRLLGGGLSTQRLLHATSGVDHQADPDAGRGLEVPEWVAAGAPLLARDHRRNWSHRRLLTWIQGIDALPDRARDAALALAADWAGTLQELCVAARVMAGEPS